ncbi:glycosyltransferase family 32 protein [Dissoconium aciculare CBS 342.82]|uniref:Glycosyltransferase family 32 protein n=1 Tax=Dissoconium aciculare CBS 342.82 TaxID=1314786 RepID=A0A6J3M9K8_9PEZI|nr:glycosyltransferase family 32 protein [Dissoconium aciculare CBS 342.82]KAF1824736.1 glycosyltransferase family 32 protein [Dissoconium aciculare CBS 342.82]
MFGPAGQPAQIPFFAFLSIKATILRLQPQQIIIHSYDLDTKNSYWKLLKPYVTLRIHDKNQLKGPDNRPLDDFALAHQADFLRLSILSKEGGIYFDTDVFPLRSFSHLLNSPRDVLMGHEGGNRYGLGNAIILARPRSEFVRLWIKTYDDNAFNPKNWNEHSILMPKRLQVRYPQLICPLSPAAFFWPTWAKKHLNYMFETLGPRPIPPVGVEGPAVQELRRNMTAYGGAMYANQLALHIRANHITEEDIIREDTRFNILLRDVVETPLP